MNALPEQPGKKRTPVDIESMFDETEKSPKPVKKPIDADEFFADDDDFGPIEKKVSKPFRPPSLTITPSIKQEEVTEAKDLSHGDDHPSLPRISKAPIPPAAHSRKVMDFHDVDDVELHLDSSEDIEPSRPADSAAVKKNKTSSKGKPAFSLRKSRITKTDREEDIEEEKPRTTSKSAGITSNFARKPSAPKDIDDDFITSQATTSTRSKKDSSLFAFYLRKTLNIIQVPAALLMLFYYVVTIITHPGIVLSNINPEEIAFMFGTDSSVYNYILSHQFIEGEVRSLWLSTGVAAITAGALLWNARRMRTSLVFILLPVILAGLALGAFAASLVIMMTSMIPFIPLTLVFGGIVILAILFLQPSTKIKR